MLIDREFITFAASGEGGEGDASPWGGGRRGKGAGGRGEVGTREGGVG